jgi:PAS domain S-box-containing protein
MNLSLVIISLSITLQLLSVFVALRMLAFRGKRTAGALMLLAAALMSFRRFVTFYRLITAGEVNIDILAEIIACIISFILLAGFLYLSRLIASHQREMSERKRSEDALRETNAKLRALIQAMPDAVYFKDCDGRLMMANKALEELFGANEKMLINKTYEDLMPPDLAKSCRKSDEELIKSRRILHTEEAMTGKDGERIYFDTVKAPIYDSRGDLLGLVGMSRDVTERKRAEEIIARLHRKNELILRSAGEGIYGLDMDGNTTFVNPAAAQMIGWEANELIGRNQHGILHHSRPDGTPYPKEDCKIYAAFKDGQVHHVTDEVFWRKDGTSFPVDYVSTPIHEGGRIVGAVVVFTDSSERKQIEVALKSATKRAKEEKAKTETIIAAIGDGISIQDTDLKIIFQNQALKDVTGEHIGEYCYKAYRNRDDICENCHLIEIFKDGKVRKLERTWSSPEGTKYFELTSSPLRDAAGMIIAGVELIKDITKRKEFEEELRSSKERLSRAQQIAHVGDWEWELATNAVHWSDELYRIYGYAPREVSPDYGLVINAMHPDSREEFLKAIDAALKGQRPFEMDYLFYRKDGSVANLHTIGMVINGADGKPERMLGIVQDITGQKKAEEALLLFRNLLNQSEDAIFVNDPATGRFLMVNNRACSNLGYGSDTLLTMRPMDIDAIFPDQASWDAHVNEVRSKGNVIVHGVHKRNDGTAYPVEVNVTYMTVGEKDYMVAVARDITERTLSEQALRLSEERLSRAQKMAHVGNWSWDIVTNELSWSEEVYHIYGVDPAQFTPTFEAVGKAMHPDDLEPFIKAVDAAIYERKPYEMDYRLIRPDGTIRTVHTIGEVTYDPAGKPLVKAGTVQDITEQKLAGETLHKTNETLAALIRYSPLAIIGTDLDSKVMIWNPAAERIFGWKEEEALGRKNPIVPEGKESEYQALRERVRQGEPYLARELVRKKRDGTLIHLDASSAAIYDADGKAILLFALFQEITERKQAEEALKKTNAQLQTLIHTIPDMVVFKDVAGRHVIVNKAVEEVIGHSKDEITGKTVEDLLPPGPAAACRKSDEEAMKRSVPSHAQERMVRVDGREAYFDMVKAPMVDPEGNVIGLVAIGRDVTEHQQIEDALRKSEANYRALLEQASDGIAVIDRQGRYLDVNSRMCDIMGYSQEEFLKLAIKDIVTSADLSAIPARLPELLAGKTVISERLMRRKDGSTFPMEISAKMIPDGRLCGIHRDISERKQVEEALKAAMLKAQEEKTKSEAVIAAIGDQMVILDPDYKVIYQNRSAVDNIGDHAGEICYKAFENKAAICEGCPVALSFKDGLVHRGERTAASVVGTLHLDITASPLKDASGKVVAVIEMVKDITERKRAEALVRESEEKYKNLVELSADIIYLSDKDGNQIFMNDQAFKALEYSPEDVIGRPWSFLIHPDDREASFKVFTAMIEQQIDMFNFENRYVTKSGKVINVLHNVSILRNEHGDIVGTQGIARDITQRKQVEDRLKLFSRAMEEATDGVQIVDLEGRIVYSNKALEEMFGYTAGELTGRHVNELGVEREFSSRVIIPGIIQTGSWSGELMSVRKDGSQFPVWLSTALVKNEKGESIALVGIIRDITERRKAEAALRKSHVELEVLVHERTAELRMINEQLSMFSSYLQEAREKERTAIAREIHDELGQSLTALKMDLSWLKKRLPKDQKPLLEKEASMSELVESTIQTVKKISSELRPGILDHLGLTAAIEWQAEEFQKRTGIPCLISIVPEEILPDKERSTTIFRIFQETLTNITRHAKATKVSVRLEKEDGRLILEVKDNGKGITEKQLSDLKSLGLMGIRERAASWGGHVNMKGVRNGGTTVIVHIPLDRTGGAA